MARDTTQDVPSGGKQVVFFFMAATVVAVVVFLCGVLVGRGVPRGGVLSASPVGEPFSTRDLPPAILTTPSSEPSAGATASRDLSYPDRLAGRAPTELVTFAAGLENLPSEARVEGGAPEPAGSGVATFAVQVAASRGEAAARAVASQLRTEGFPVYVLDPFPDDPVPFFRVRVGPFPSRRDADQVRAQLVDDERMPGAYVTE